MARPIASHRALRRTANAFAVSICLDDGAPSSLCDVEVVARDGIEPPTPAFSGPRSTTELPGLSAELGVRDPAGGSAQAGGNL